MDLFPFGDEEPTQQNENFETFRTETESLPPLVELGRKLLAKAQEGDTEAVRELMRQGAPFTADWLGTSAIHWACQLNHYSTAELLLKAGISRDARNKVDRTPLHVTATEGHVDILKLLLKHGVDVDAVDMLRMTPLHWAAEYGHGDCVIQLLEHGADPSALNKFNKTADQIAFDNNFLEITRIIQEYAESPMFHARRKMAKEKLKQAAAAHKATVERERAQLMRPSAIPYVNNLVEKTGEKKAVNVQGARVQIVNENGAMTPKSAQFSTVPSPCSTEKTMAMLQAHGIMMLPKDESTIVASAVNSGQKVQLTEAGKMALTLTKSPGVKPPTQIPVKGLVRLPPALLHGKKVITIRADQLINMKNERKVIIQKQKSPQSNMEVTDISPAKKVEVVITKKLVNSKSPSNIEKPTPCALVTSSTAPANMLPKKVMMRIRGGSEYEKIKSELEETKQELNHLRQKYVIQGEELAKYKQRLE